MHSCGHGVLRRGQTLRPPWCCSPQLRRCVCRGAKHFQQLVPRRLYLYTESWAYFQSKACASTGISAFPNIEFSEFSEKILAQDFNTMHEYKAHGNSMFQVPSGVTKLLVYVWGAGGGGGSALGGVASGGGGGGFSMQAMAVIPGERYAIVVGKGGRVSAECAVEGVVCGHAGGGSSFGSIAAAGGSPGCNAGGPTGVGGGGSSEDGLSGIVAGGTAGGSGYGGGTGGRAVPHGVISVGGEWPGGGSSELCSRFLTSKTHYIFGPDISYCDQGVKNALFYDLQTQRLLVLRRTQLL